MHPKQKDSGFMEEREADFLDILLENDTIRKQPHLEENLGPVEQFVDELLEAKLRGPGDEDEEEEADAFGGEDTEE